MEPAQNETEKKSFQITKKIKRSMTNSQYKLNKNEQ
jgi:hypothetical protein